MMDEPDEKPFIIPVFIPHEGCPHRCIFCNQSDIARSESGLEASAMRAHIDRYLSYKGSRRGRVQISFYGGTFLGLSAERLSACLDLAEEYVHKGLVHSLRCSTRPDTITDSVLQHISTSAMSTVELGVQSMNDRVLERSHRGHTREDTLRAVQKLKTHGFETGLQMMVGLPGDTPGSALQSARDLIRLEPDFVRIYPTVVLSNSPLAQLFKTGVYKPLALDDAVDEVKDLFLLFKKHGIPVIRMGLQAADGLADDILAGPYHPAFGHLVQARVFLDMARSLLIGERPPVHSTVTFFVHPINISRIRGLKNNNLHVLRAEFSLADIRVAADDSMPSDSLRTEQSTTPWPEPPGYLGNGVLNGNR